MLKEAMSNTILSNLQVQMLNHSNSKSKIWTPEKTRDHAHFTQPHAENEQAQSSFQSPTNQTSIPFHFHPFLAATTFIYVSSL